MSRFFQTEPAIILGFVSAVLVLLTAFGVQMTDDQTAAITGIVSAVLVLGGAFVTRKAVTPNVKVVARETSDGAVVSGPADPTSPDGAEVVVATMGADDIRVDPANAEE